MSNDFRTDDDVVIKEEQTYFDDALEHRERSRQKLREAPAMAIHKGAAAGLEQIRKETEARLRPPEDAVAFGRFDTAEGATYLGYNAIWTDERDLLVVNWRAKAADQFFEATHLDSHGLISRREFECDSNTIVSFDDTFFMELAADVAKLQQPEISDALLADMDRGRTGEMHDIVKTIQAAQYSIMREDMDQLLVVQGGPGTGKTAVGLHRVSWLLYRFDDRLKPQDVLIVGPNRTFIRYIRSVLPTLGDNDIRHSDIAGLSSVDVRIGREEDSDVIRLKGERRMTGLIQRALRARVIRPTKNETARVAGITVTFMAADLNRVIEGLEDQPFAAGRTRFRDYLREEASRLLGDAAPMNDSALENLVDRIWPSFTPPAFLQEFFGSTDRILGAAGDEFTASEVRLLYRKSAERISEETWSAADSALLDYVDSLISGRAPTYKHIVVDEAQDLSPMQLLMISRRSSEGAFTVLGDLAQSTGPWARDDWSEVTELLRGALPVKTTELAYGYRVPRQIFEFAAKLLPYAAPGVSVPQVVRDGTTDPRLQHVEEDDRCAAVVQAAREYAANGNFVGIISPQAFWDEVSEALKVEDIRFATAANGAAGASITLLLPEEAKGLEYDAIVVVEPEEIAKEDGQGLRLLYVALTRTTRHLTVVHTGAVLPIAESLEPPPSPQAPKLANTPHIVAHSEGNPLVDQIADGLAQQIRTAIQPALWDQVLDRIRRSLDR